MRDFELKNILSKLTGISLTKTSSLEKEAMATWVGQTGLVERLNWEMFSIESIPGEFPGKAKTWLINTTQRFKQEYLGSLPEGEQGNFNGMIFLWYGYNDAITNDIMTKLDQLEPTEENEEIKNIAKFVQEKKVPLLCSPEELQNRKTDDSEDSKQEDSFNGSETHLLKLGPKFWGATVETDENNDPKVLKYQWKVVPAGQTDKQLEATSRYQFNNVPRDKRFDGSSPEKMVHLGYPVIAEKDGAFGIFGKLPNGELKALISEEAAAALDSGSNLGKGGALRLFNQQQKVFNFNGSKFLPASTIFKLTNVVNNAPTPESRVEARLTTGKGRPALHITGAEDSFKVYFASNGTFHWKAMKTGKIFPMTKEQIVQIAPIGPKDRYLIGQQPIFAVHFNSDMLKQKYEKDCENLNKLRNLIISPKFNTENISSISPDIQSLIKNEVSGNVNPAILSQIRQKYGITTNQLYEILVSDLNIGQRETVKNYLYNGVNSKKISDNTGIDVGKVEILRTMYLGYPVADGKLHVLLVCPSGNESVQTNIDETVGTHVTNRIQTGPGKVKRRLTVLRKKFDALTGKTNLGQRTNAKETTEMPTEETEKNTYQEALNYAVSHFGLNKTPSPESIETAQKALEGRNVKFLNRDPNAQPNLMQEGQPEEPASPGEQAIQSEEDFSLDEPQAPQPPQDPQPPRGGPIFGKSNGFVKSSKDILSKLKKYN